jgi:hypothetical protein
MKSLLGDGRRRKMERSLIRVQIPPSRRTFKRVCRRRGARTRTKFRREISWGTYGAQFREVSARPRSGLCRASNELKPAIGGSAPSVVQAAEPPTTAESSTAIVSRLKPDRDHQDRGPQDADRQDADRQYADP